MVRVGSRCGGGVVKEAPLEARDRQKIAKSVGYRAVGPAWAPKEMARGMGGW